MIWNGIFMDRHAPIPTKDLRFNRVGYQMAGVKGRSGGAREGAGRKPIKPRVEESLEPQPHGGALRRTTTVAPELCVELTDGRDRDSLTFLKLVMKDPGAPLKDRIRAAVAAAQYEHPKRGEGGKREAAADRAKRAATGKYAAPTPPTRRLDS